MVLDIEQFRTEKGGNLDKIRENQRKRFCDESMVDKIVEADEKWRKGMCKYCWGWPSNNQRFKIEILVNLKYIYIFFFLARFNADEYNKLKNMVSKVIGEKMKVCILKFNFFLYVAGFAVLLVGEGFLSYFFYYIRKVKVFQNSNRNLYFRLLLTISRPAMKKN